jgi:hypothetical protein
MNIFLLTVFSIFSIYLVSFFNEKISKTFSLLTERIDSDSRSTVHDCFYSDMRFNDFIFGKGIDGRFYCPGADNDYDNNTTSIANIGYRYNIETGYLDIILKGGVLSLLLYFLINLSAAFNGAFSKNGLAKGASLYLILNFSNIWIENSQSFTFRYMLVWLSIGICFSKELKSFTDSEIKKKLKIC